MSEFVNSKFVKKISEIIYTSYTHGWDERNGGNVSLRIDGADLADYADVKKVNKTIDLGFDARTLAGQ
ncbi:hypothetical protein FD21_GL001657 [Liquorilactobacillus vini DSM 20605]|uniref:Rhamnulose-1-phosphate aldolase n=1 Tax=Liquorilactobacillus vini DSM 20605 TaxID=1133569 RepID=A0A0R2C8P4_9LACO|nr:hypothetical protein FD21_GL001657 [Liquorilactobacillus vini DSM 20605]